MVKQLVNQKINTLSSEELVKLSKQYGLQISRPQAASITKLLKGKHIDIFNDQERHGILRTISKQTNPQLASQINQLFKNFL